MALISDDYRALNAELHKTNPKFGSGGAKFAKRFEEYVGRYGKDVLDYGCGKGNLSQKFDFVKNYDPCIPEFSALPKPAAFVVCRDVMEHVEDESIDEVLDHIRFLAFKAAYFEIGTLPSGEILPDGRNCHISLHPPEWWKEKLKRRWRSVKTVSYVGTKNVEFLCE